jgi:hypothetical protein
MPRSRFATRTLLFAAGFALLMPAARGQPDSQLPDKPRAAMRAIGDYREIPRGGIPEADLPKARESFKAFAKYYADVIAHPLVWKASQEIKADPFARIPVIDGPNGILREIDRYLLEPVPGGAKMGNFEPASYVREMGAALDAALKNLIETHPERIVRVNAARVLAHVARTGAPAHFRTVTALLADPKTSPEIKYYLFRAAAGVLGAIDPTDQMMRKHAADPKTVGALVKVVEESVANPAMLLPGYKPELATEDQLQVIALVRRQAVRALAQVKFVTIPGPDDKAPALYPSYTLVRVAMSDPRLVPAPGPAECAEAAIGLCNMAAWQWKGDSRVPLKNYNAEVAVEAIAQALITFAEPRAGNRNDRTLPWRAYAVRIAEAMTKAKPLYDPDATPPYQPTKYAAQLVPESFERLYRFALPNVLAPLDKVDNKDNPAADPDVPRLRQFLAAMKQNPKRKTVLFEGVPETTINFPEPKK